MVENRRYNGLQETAVRAQVEWKEEIDSSVLLLPPKAPMYTDTESSTNSHPEKQTSTYSYSPLLLGGEQWQLRAQSVSLSNLTFLFASNSELADTLSP